MLVVDEDNSKPAGPFSCGPGCWKGVNVEVTKVNLKF